MPAHHFLVPIDFSPDADDALEYAMELARQLQAKLTLLHVLEPLVVSSVEIMPAPFLQAAPWLPRLAHPTERATTLPVPWPQARYAVRSNYSNLFFQQQ